MADGSARLPSSTAAIERRVDRLLGELREDRDQERHRALVVEVHDGLQRLGVLLFLVEVHQRRDRRGLVELDQLPPGFLALADVLELADPELGRVGVGAAGADAHQEEASCKDTGHRTHGTLLVRRRFARPARMGLRGAAGPRRRLRPYNTARAGRATITRASAMALGSRRGSGELQAAVGAGAADERAHVAAGGAGGLVARRRRGRRAASPGTRDRGSPRAWRPRASRAGAAARPAARPRAAP